MSFLDTLERHLGKFAIPGLIRYVVGFTAATYVISLANFEVMSRLVLSGPLVLSGEIWRLVTWPFLPPTLTFFGVNLPILVQVILMVFVLRCLWTFGDILESAWGTFRVNAYFFCGMAGCIATAILLQTGGVFFTGILSLSILFAVAMVAPDFQILLFLVLPVRLKWIAWFSLAWIAIQIVVSPWIIKLAILLSLANCLVFLLPSLVKQGKDMRQIAARRAKFQAASATDETLHRCETCGRTEVSNPELDFRVSADGHEYCVDHLRSRSN